MRILNLKSIVTAAFVGAVIAAAPANAAEIDWNSQMKDCRATKNSALRNQCFQRVALQQRVDEAYSKKEEITITVDANDDNDAASVADAKKNFNAALNECSHAGNPSMMQSCRADAVRTYQSAIKK